MWFQQHDSQRFPASPHPVSVWELRRPVGLVLKANFISLHSVTHGHVSRFSRCRWWNPQIICNFTLRNIIFKSFNYFCLHNLQIAVTLTPSFFSDSLCGDHFIPFYDTKLLPINLIGCKTFYQVFFFPSVVPIPTFLKHIAGVELIFSKRILISVSLYFL